METVTNNAKHVIFSKSERGFWHNLTGWVEDFSDATRFSGKRLETFNLPMASGNDSAWVPVTDLQGVIYVCRTCGEFVSDGGGYDGECGSCADLAEDERQTKELMECKPLRKASRKAMEAFLKLQQAMREVWLAVGTGTDFDAPNTTEVLDGLEAVYTGFEEGEVISDVTIDGIIKAVMNLEPKEEEANAE